MCTTTNIVISVVEQQKMKTVIKEYASAIIALVGTVLFLELMWEFLFSNNGLFVKMIALVGNGGIG